MKILVLGAQARYEKYLPQLPFIRQQELVFRDKDTPVEQLLARDADADILFVDAITQVPAALRAITGNGVNVLAMGAFYVAPQMGCDIADAYLGASLGSGYEWWHNFYEFHKLAIDELEAFDYDEYRKAGFKVKHLGDYPLSLETKPEE